MYFSCQVAQVQQQINGIEDLGSYKVEVYRKKYDKNNRDRHQQLGTKTFHLQFIRDEMKLRLPYYQSPNLHVTNKGKKQGFH